MKILFETGSTCIGGAERVVLRLAQGIRRLRPNWQVDAIVLAERGGLEQEYQQTFHHLIDGPGESGYHLSGLAIAALVKEHGYYIVHCIDSFHLTGVAAELCPTTHFIQACYPNLKTSPFAPKQDWIDRQSQYYSAIVTEFQANLQYLKAPRRPPGILTAIANGIDTEFWTPEDCQRDIDVLWCARTDPEKGIETAMELVPLLCDKGLDYRIITSEYDGPTDKLTELATQYDNFTYYSGLPPTHLRAMFRRTKIFLSTSKVEGMPATPLEAAACGCWPIVPSIDGLEEVFGNRVWPFTYPSTFSLAELERDITVALNRFEPDVLPKIAEEYSVEAMVQSYITLYTQLLETPL